MLSLRGTAAVASCVPVQLLSCRRHVLPITASNCRSFGTSCFVIRPSIVSISVWTVDFSVTRRLAAVYRAQRALLSFRFTDCD